MSNAKLVKRDWVTVDAADNGRDIDVHGIGDAISL
jgi:hypothetical protein